MKRTKFSSTVNPLRIAPGDVVKDLRPLVYGKQYVVRGESKSQQFKGWLVMDCGTVLHPQRLALVKRANGHLV